MFIKDLKEDLDEVGVMIVKELLEETDEVVKASKDRKRNWYVERKADKRTLLTIFGEVNYQRTYYKNKKTKEYKYLSDELVGINKSDRMDMYLSSEIIEKASSVSYKKSAEEVCNKVSLSSQTVMNQIRKIGKLENYKQSSNKAKKEKKILYIS